MVGKKDGRFVLHSLNKTHKDAYPFPLPDQVQDKLSGMKTDFSPGPGLGLYEFNILAFGLTGGPSALGIKF